MADTTFISRRTPINATWLNDVNRAVYRDLATVANDPYSADSTGVDDITSKVTELLALSDEIKFGEGTWKITSTPSFTGTKVLRASTSANITGAGGGALGFYTSQSGSDQTIYWNSFADQGPSRFIRRFANHSGGTVGYVNAALEVRTDVTNAANTNYEWTFLSTMYNYADAGENVAAYLQGRKYGVGATWGATIEVMEMTATNDPTTGTIGLEVDVNCNGTDNAAPYGARVGVDLAIRKNPLIASVTPAYASWGYRIQGDTGAKVGRGFSFFPGMTADVAFDASTATVNQSALRMAENQAITFTATDTRALFYDGTGIKFTGAAGVLLGRFNDTGILQMGVASTAAGTPASFSANRTIQIQQLDGTILYIPAMLATW